MPIFISPAKRSYVENCPIYYPFGGKYLKNALRNYKGSQSKEIKVN